MANLRGLLGAIADLPGVINQGLLGPLPVDPGVESIIGSGQVSAARQRASNDFAMALLGNQGGASLPGASQYAREGFSGRIFDLLKQQEAARLMEAQQAEMQRQAAFRADPTLANASIATQEQALLDQARQAGRPGGAQFGNVNPGDFTPASLAKYAQTGNFADLERYVSPGTDKVVVIGGVPSLVDPRSHSVTPLSTPQAELDATADEARSRVTGEASGKAAAFLPQAELNAKGMLDVLGALERSPGFDYVYGVASLAPIIPGTPQADTFALWEQVQGKAFLQAFETLKGGGQITEKEGEKATAAITRLANRRQSPKAARQALNELRSIVNTALEKSRKQAGQPSMPEVGEVRRGYRFKGGDPSDPASWEKL